MFLSPICDGTRLLFGIIATLSGMVFAGMTSALKNNIENLFFRRFQSLRNRTAATDIVPGREGLSGFFGWFLLVASFCTTVFLGSYVAAVPSKTCVDIIISDLVCKPVSGVDEVEGEYVVIQNLSNKKQNLQNWSLCDYQSHHCFEFDSFTIQPQASIKLWTKAGTDTTGDLYFNSSMPIWNNATDTAYLYDVKEQLIDQMPCPKKNTTAETTPTLPEENNDLGCIPGDTTNETGRVVDVIDGRTIDVELEDGSVVRVRYLGIATIVEGQLLYKNSVNINRELVMGKTVTMVSDPDSDEISGLLLRYVIVDDTFVNYELVLSGYAVPDAYCSCIDDFMSLHMATAESDRGFFGSSIEAYGDPFFDTPPPGYFTINEMEITEVFYDGDKGEHEPDEYVEIGNNGDDDIQLMGWSLSDSSEHIFVFPKFLLAPGEKCRVYTNETHSNWCGFNFESSQAIWGNSGDCATLIDADGMIIDQYCYD